jgi:hypothetical protein
MRRTFLALWVFACGGQTSTGMPDGGGSDAAPMKDSGYPDSPGEPPPPKPDSGPPTTSTMTFALQTMFLGEADRTGDPPSSTAWAAYGYDLDGLVTAQSSTNVCTLYKGAPASTQIDGTAGNDNSWGENLLPIFTTVQGDPTPSKTETQYIDSGGWTVQLQVTGLSNDPSQNATGLLLSIFLSGQYGNGPPAFDATTDWPVLSTSVVDGATIASGSTAQFKSAYVSNGTVVSGSGPDPLGVTLNFSGVPVALKVHTPLITFDHSSPGLITNGLIAGVLDAQEFIAAMKVVAGNISMSLCGTGFDGVAQQIEQCVDILDDGTNKSGVPCTGISVGIGFSATLVANPTMVAQPPTPPPNPCP